MTLKKVYMCAWNALSNESECMRTIIWRSKHLTTAQQPINKWKSSTKIGKLLQIEKEERDRRKREKLRVTKKPRNWKEKPNITYKRCLHKNDLNLWMSISFAFCLVSLLCWWKRVSFDDQTTVFFYSRYSWHCFSLLLFYFLKLKWDNMQGESERERERCIAWTGQMEFIRIHLA